jgi:hypothetical protein
VRLHTHFIFFFTGVEYYRRVSWGFGFLEPKHHIDSINFFDLLPIPSISANPFTRENGSALYPPYDHGVQHLVVYLIFAFPSLLQLGTFHDTFLLSAHTLNFYRWVGVWIFALLRAFCGCLSSSWCRLGQMRGIRRYLFIMHRREWKGRL